MTVTDLKDLRLDFDNPPKPYDILDHGYDTSGRQLLLTARHTLFLIILGDRLTFTTWPVQGEWMSKVPGGGAADSAHYHDRAGNVDIHTSGFSRAQCLELARKGRLLGGTMNLRGMGHDSMPPHCHNTLMGTKPSEASPGEQSQEDEYVAGGDGLVGDVPDWEWRPDPLVTDFDYYDELRQWKEDAMPTVQDFLNAEINADGVTVRQSLRKMVRFVDVGAPDLRQRLASVDDTLSEVESKVSDAATKEQVKRARADVKGIQADVAKLAESAGDDG